MTRNKSNFFIDAGPLLLVLFIDGMGLGLVVPILNGLIFDKNSTFLNAASFTPLMHNVIYGSVICVFMLCWFFGAAILGDLSDQIGRKKSLIICLVGAMLSYILSGIAVNFHSLALIILGRVVAGFTSGSQPIAQAAIIDISSDEHKTRNLGYILLALSMGLILGPLIGGILSDRALCSWFNFSTPFYFAALISLANILLLRKLYSETIVTKPTTFAINPYQAINIFVSAFKHDKVRNLSVIYFVYIFGWSSFYSFISLYLLQIFNFTPTMVSIFMAVMGIGFAVGNGFLVNYLAKFFHLRDNFIYPNICAAAMIILMVLLRNQLFDWLIMAPVSCMIAVSYPSILTLFSNQVSAESQGWIMGITGSISAFVWAVNGVIVGVLAALSVVYPLYVSAIALFLSALMMYPLFKIEK